MDNTNEIKDEPGNFETGQEINRTKLKEERRLRNKQKKAAKKLQKQKEREQKELILKLQLKSHNVTMITRDFAEKVVGNSDVKELPYRNPSISGADFPMLGAKCSKTSISQSNNSTKAELEVDAVSSGDKRATKIELSDFLNIPTTTSKQAKTITQTVENYKGNPLDSDMPIRMKGKFREVPKIKKPNKLKRDILKEQSECKEIQSTEGNTETCLLMDTNMCANVVTEELNNLVKTFISSVVGLQEKLYKRDPIKGAFKRRYVVGLHEVKKYLNINKVKILIIAPDINLRKRDGALENVIKQIIDVAKNNNVPYLFALKRRLLGVLTLKYIPVSCIAVINYEGLEVHFNNILKFLQSEKEENNEKCAKNTNSDINTNLLNNLIEAFKGT